MKKKYIIGSFLVLLLLLSPFISNISAFQLPIHKTKTMNNLDSGTFTYRFLCHVNSTGYGKAVHSGNGMFVALEYDEECDYINTTIKSFIKTTTLTEPHRIQVFFLLGDYDLPFSGTEGNCSINGMVLMAFIW